MGKAWLECRERLGEKKGEAWLECRERLGE
jgi:hypothetical protein